MCVHPLVEKAKLERDRVTMSKSCGSRSGLVPVAPKDRMSRGVCVCSERRRELVTTRQISARQEKYFSSWIIQLKGLP